MNKLPGAQRAQALQMMAEGISLGGEANNMDGCDISSAIAKLR